MADTWVDAKTARNAGCPFALVEWGFPRPPMLGGIQADLRVERVGELAAAL